MSDPFEFSGLGSEEVEFERDTHVLKLREVYDILVGKSNDTVARHNALGKLLNYLRADTPSDAYVHREDYDDDIKMLEAERDEFKGQVDERDATINSLEYDIKQLQEEFQDMEEQRDIALRDAENNAEEVSSLRGQLESAEEDAAQAWNRVGELEES